MNKRMFLVLLLVTIAGAGVGTGAWFLHNRTSGHSAPAGPLRSVPELEELVYRTPFDSGLQFELARASWQKFENSMKTDEAASSESMTAYGIAAIESGSRQDIVDELRDRLQTIKTLETLPEGSFDEDYSAIKTLYRGTSRPSIEQILRIRNDIESTCTRIRADDRGLQDVVAAQVAVERYLLIVYDVEIGLKQVPLPDGGNVKYTKAFYDRMEQGLRSYGLIVESNPELIMSNFVVKGSLSAPIDASASQIDSGEWFGRFRLPDGSVAIPGLRYFEDAATTGANVDNPGLAPHSDVQGPLADSASADSPVAVSRRMLQMREQGQWSEAYDLIEADSRRKLVAGIKQVIRQQLTNPNEQQSFDAMSDREIWILVGQTGEVHPTEIVGSETHSDSAVVRTRMRVNDNYVNGEANLIRVNGVWRIIGDGGWTFRFK